jgi:hypothetical protein
VSVCRQRHRISSWSCLTTHQGTSYAEKGLDGGLRARCRSHEHRLHVVMWQQVEVGTCGVGLAESYEANVMNTERPADVFTEPEAWLYINTRMRCSATSCGRRILCDVGDGRPCGAASAGTQSQKCRVAPFSSAYT